MHDDLWTAGTLPGQSMPSVQSQEDRFVTLAVVSPRAELELSPSARRHLSPARRQFLRDAQ